MPGWIPELAWLDSRAVERSIDLDGCVNFRDLGGYPTSDGRRLRWRLLFRSDALHAVSPADVSHLRDALALSDIVDLRSSFELESEGRGPLAKEPIDFHHTPLFDGDPSVADRSAAATMSLGDRYVGMMEMARPKIIDVVRILANSQGGAVYHCAAGKDRTGVISAVLLGALGVPDELIVADYALSGERIDEIIARVMSMKGYEETLHEMPEDTLHAHPESMETVLARVAETWGSMVDYLQGGGLESTDLERLRSKCLD
jgi:protein tyrosine/serine phosphatase